jgi:protoheme ferro-lyase
VNTIRGVNYAEDTINDVLRIQDGKIKSVSNYHDEIDIVSLDLQALKIKLELQAIPILNDSNHLYTVEIIWTTAGNYENKTEITVGSLNDEVEVDIINHTIVDESGNPLPEQPSPILDATVIEGTKLVWALDIWTNDPEILFDPVNVNATAQFSTIERNKQVLYKDAIFEGPIVIQGIEWNLNTVLSIAGTVLVCGFAGYTLGSITVYFLTTNVRSKQTNTICMAVFVVGLAVLVNVWFWLSPWQIFWNVGIFLLAIVFGYMYATRGIMKLKFDSPLPENLPIDTDEELEAVIILAKGESEDYNPLPLIRRFYKNKETSVEQRPKYLQPLTLFETKRKYNIITRSQRSLTQEDIRFNVPRNPYRKLVGDIKDQLDESIFNFDMCQEAFVNDWPTFNQALLAVISRGAHKVTILNLFMAENFDYELAIQEMGKIDYSQIGVTILQTDFLAENKELQEYIANKIKKKAGDADLKQTGVLLIADGQPPEWDEIYPLTTEETKFQEGIKGNLTKLGFKKDNITFAWIENRNPTIQEGIEILVAKGCSTIVTAAATTPVDCLDTLYEIPTAVAKSTAEKNVKVIPVNAWNADEEVIQLYLRLLTSAKKLPLEELGKDADIVLQQIGVGAKLAESDKEDTTDSKDE